MGRLHRRYKRNPGSSAPKANPPLVSEIGEFIIPGFAGFASTRLLTRIAATQVAKYKPELANHAGALTSIAAFLAAWFLAHRLKFTARYQQPLVVGAGLAAIQSLLQLYFPKLGWIVSDASPEIADAATAAQAAAVTAAQPQLLTTPTGVQYRAQDVQAVHVDPNEFTYDDSYDAGRMSRDPAAAQQSDADALADLELDDSVPQAAGIFGGN